MDQHLELMKIIIAISLFLADNHGFTPDEQAEYKAKAEIVLDFFRENPGEFREITDDLYSDFADLMQKKKEKIVNG